MLKQFLKAVPAEFLCDDQCVEPETVLLYYFTMDAVYEWMAPKIPMEAVGVRLDALISSLLKPKSKQAPYVVLKIGGRADKLKTITIRKDLIPIIEALTTAPCPKIIDAIEALPFNSVETLNLCQSLAPPFLAPNQVSPATQASSQTSSQDSTRAAPHPEPKDSVPQKQATVPKNSKESGPKETSEGTFFTHLEPPTGSPSEAQAAIITTVTQIASRTIQNVALVSGPHKSGRSSIATFSAWRLAQTTGAKIYRLKPLSDNIKVFSSLVFESESVVLKTTAAMLALILAENQGQRPVFLLDDIDALLATPVIHPVHDRQISLIGASFFGKTFVSQLAAIGRVIGTVLKKETASQASKSDQPARPLFAGANPEAPLDPISAIISCESAIVQDLPLLINGLLAASALGHPTAPAFAPDAASVLLGLVAGSGRLAPEMAHLVMDQAQGIAQTIAQTNNQPTVDTATLDAAAKIFGLEATGRLRSEDTGRRQASDLLPYLATRIFGQDHALETIASKMRIVLCGLNDAQKPLASLLFVGPTGVGKTEIVKEMAAHLKMNVIRIDMSEYSDPSSINKLIGTPPGYKDGERGGKLSNGLALCPKSIVLLDEAEKAHPQIHNLFLQMMDNGEFGNGQGHMISCRSAILIFTSNAGASRATTLSDLGAVIGFHATADKTADYTRGMDRAVEAGVASQFSPEFRGRLDAVVRFKSITFDVASRITEKLLTDLEASILARHGVRVTHDQGLSRFLTGQGFSLELGARTLIGQIDRLVKPVLADRFLGGLDPNASLVLEVTQAEGAGAQVRCRDDIQGENQAESQTLDEAG